MGVEAIAFDLAADFALDVALDFAPDIGSLVTDLGTEFLDVSSFTSFEIPSFDVTDFGGFDVAGSFAGDAGWFDTFNPGAILDNVPAVSDFGGLTRSLEIPSLSSIKDVASTVQQTAGGFVSSAQTAFSAYQKVAPLVDLGASALGIQNPVNAILAPVSQAVGIAGAAAGVAGSVTTGSAGSLLTNPTVVSTALSLAGGAAAPLAQTIGTGVSLYNTANTIGSTINSVSQPGAVVATNGIFGGTFRELNAAETAVLERNIDPAYINRLTDPAVAPPLNYNTALVSRDELNLSINSFNTEIANGEQAIQSNNANIAAAEAELADPNLPDDRRSYLEDILQVNYENNAIQQNILDSNRAGLSAAVSSLAADQAVINGTNATVTRSPADVPDITTTTERDRTLAAVTAAGGIPSVANIIQSPAGVAVNSGVDAFERIVGTDPGTGVGVQARNLVREARNQQALRNISNTKAQSSDWRVRLRLAPNSNYLYNAPAPGLLAPLSAKEGTDGVIFPYTPAIDTAYKANYDPYDLTHANYRGYFYRNSYVDAVNIRAQFTAQDTTEANYLLAVIHFFRSATKMFYGQDTQRGAPPPLVFLSGLGDFQFNEHPCVISQFNYQLPSDVDYIRAQNALDNSTNFLANRVRSTIPGNPLSFGINRLLNNALTKGALDPRPTQGNLPIETPTYVPTKMEMSISLLPIVSRQQISKQFSLQGFADGNLLKGGFW